MILIGLTGGMGSGKTTLSPWLDALGWTVIDADQLAREVVAPGEKAWCDTVDLLGEQVLQSDRQLDRQKIASIVFADPKLLKIYQSIIHKEIHLTKQTQLTALYKADHQVKVVYAVPLLFETRMEAQFQKTVLIQLDPSEQFRRLVEGRKMDPEDVKRRLKSQLPLEEKLQLADFVIDNNGSLAACHSQVESLFLQLSSLPHRPLEETLGRI